MPPVHVSTMVLVVMKPMSVNVKMTTQGISVRHVSTISYLLPPANEVWGKVIFLHLFVILFTEGGSSTVHVGIPPLLPRRPPTKETPLPRRPRCQGNPPGQGDPLARRPPPTQSMLADTVNAGGTHPTGMQSCDIRMFLIYQSYESTFYIWKIY